MKDNEKKIYTKEEINQHASFFDAEIIPNVYYQVYGFDKVYCHDDEGANYDFNNENHSTIKIQVAKITPKYYKVGALSFTNAPAGAEGGTKVSNFTSVPENAKVGDLFYTVSNEEKTYKIITATLTLTDVQTEINNAKGQITDTTAAPAGAVKDNVYLYLEKTWEPAEPSAAEPYEYNKYGVITSNSEVKVELTLAQALISAYPTVTVNVDGKDYDKGNGTKTYIFTMAKDHRININWVYGEIVETFRITCNR